MTDHAVLGEEIALRGANGDWIEGFYARPLGLASIGSVVVIHHMPGYDEATKEIALRFARHGYAALMPNLYFREAPNAAPDDAAAIARSKGGVPDDRLLGDVAGARDFLLHQPNANGKSGVIGYCSGGRQSFLSGCELPFDAVVDCYGAFVVNQPPAESPMQVSAVVDRASKLTGPVLGLFGNEDSYPGPDEVNALDAELTKLGKPHEFHRYDGAGHAFFNTAAPSYRPEAAKDAWGHIFTFFAANLGAQ
jgi:carboxymethylenebutenolidase